MRMMYCIVFFFNLALYLVFLNSFRLWKCYQEEWIYLRLLHEIRKLKSVVFLTSFWKVAPEETGTDFARHVLKPEMSETIGQPALQHLHVIYSRATEYICLDYPWNKPAFLGPLLPQCSTVLPALVVRSGSQESRQMALVYPVYARLHHAKDFTMLLRDP